MMRSQNLKLKKPESVRRIMLERIIESKPFKSAARKTGNVVKVTL